MPDGPLRSFPEVRLRFFRRACFSTVSAQDFYFHLPLLNSALSWNLLHPFDPCPTTLPSVPRPWFGCRERQIPLTTSPADTDSSISPPYHRSRDHGRPVGKWDSGGGRGNQRDLRPIQGLGRSGSLAVKRV